MSFDLSASLMALQGRETDGQPSQRESGGALMKPHACPHHVSQQTVQNPVIYGERGWNRGNRQLLLLWFFSS